MISLFMIIPEKLYTPSVNTAQVDDSKEEKMEDH